MKITVGPYVTTQEKVKWAVAGRSREKLDDLKTEISQLLGRQVVKRSTAVRVMK